MGYSPTMCSSSREALFISGKFTTIILSAPLSTTLMLDRVNQERTHAEYLRHLYQTARKSKEEQKEGFKQLHAEMTQGYDSKGASSCEGTSSIHPEPTAPTLILQTLVPHALPRIKQRRGMMS